jgi:glycosyltransferase involved in cell wall biosynthesis
MSRRVRAWHDLLGAQGIETVDLPVFDEGSRLRPGFDHLVDVARGLAAPETLAWAGLPVLRALERAAPDAVVVASLRAFDRRIVGLAPRVVLDLIDLMSSSYRQRSALESRAPARWAWLALAQALGRVEGRLSESAANCEVVAAGWPEAEAAGARWLPNLVQAPRAGRSRTVRGPEEGGVGGGPDLRDVLFVGTLDYLPNVAALRVLAEQVWPAVLKRRPGTTLRVAGRRPTTEVRRLARHLGAELVVEFADPVALYRATRVAVAPLPEATGSQYKVLDAAGLGVPLVISPSARAGFDPEFPIGATALGEPFAQAVVGLIEDPASARSTADRARLEVRDRYGEERWAPVAAEFALGPRTT